MLTVRGCCFKDRLGLLIVKAVICKSEHSLPLSKLISRLHSSSGYLTLAHDLRGLTAPLHLAVFVVLWRQLHWISQWHLQWRPLQWESINSFHLPWSATMATMQCFQSWQCPLHGTPETIHSQQEDLTPVQKTAAPQPWDLSSDFAWEPSPLGANVAWGCFYLQEESYTMSVLAQRHV